MPSYEELKSELESIAGTVERFPESVRPRVFELLVQTFLGQSLDDVGGTHAQPPPAASAAARRSPSRRTEHKPQKTDPATSDSPQKQRRRGSSKESYSIDRELNLRGDKSIPSFVAFVEDKKPATTQEFNAVVVYYLQKMLGLAQVSLDHAYTCYKEAGRRPPEAFKQSFTDTKNRQGWVEFDAEGGLRVPHRGSIFVEHDLPRESAKK